MATMHSNDGFWLNALRSSRPRTIWESSQETSSSVVDALTPLEVKLIIQASSDSILRGNVACARLIPFSHGVISIMNSALSRTRLTATATAQSATDIHTASVIERRTHRAVAASVYGT